MSPRKSSVASSLSSSGDPLWYKDAIIYELHVRAFYDGNGDGIGDFRGLTQKLDYFQDLGVNTLWLLPFFPSPLKDDGYDIADYTNIHPAYGTLQDFRQFLREAHKRDLKVVIELVLNHTSDQHRWFQQARHAKPGSKAREFYVWSDSPSKYEDVRIIFQDYESSNWSWDPVAKAYYWHRFYSHQPDLNFDNPRVQKAVMQVAEFWMNMGVDGFRLDAVPYLFERDGTNCENLPETHDFLKKFKRHITSRYKNRMLLAEANQWAEDAMEYFGKGDECDMAFNFPIMPRMFISLQMEDRFPLLDILEQTPSIPDRCQWALFLRNHDELTLEMVTDEERDYLYRVYAQDPQMRINLGIRRRLAPLLGNNRRKMELMYGLLFSLPGTPVIYYGDDIGMGDNIYLGDRNGVRTPMQWSADRNAGFSQANPQRLFLPIIVDPEHHYESVNVEGQQRNANSLLWWLKRLIALRNHHKAFGRGEIEVLLPDNRKIFAFVRTLDDEQILVVTNLSRFVQFVELDLKDFQDLIPIEMFGQTAFPGISRNPYPLTLGPHSFYWFHLNKPQPSDVPVSDGLPDDLPTIETDHPWDYLLNRKNLLRVQKILQHFLKRQRWFSGKSQKIHHIQPLESMTLNNGGHTYRLLLVRVDYYERDSETYLLPLAYGAQDQKLEVLLNNPGEILAKVQGKKQTVSGVLYDALCDVEFCRQLLQLFVKRGGGKRNINSLKATTTSHLKNYIKEVQDLPAGHALRGDQSNSSILYGDGLILKVFRKVDDGINPDLEISRLLTSRQYANSPPLAGCIEYGKSRQEPVTLGILHRYVTNEGNAWDYTLDHLEQYFERLQSTKIKLDQFQLPGTSIIEAVEQDVPSLAHSQITTFLGTAAQLGECTAGLHASLAEISKDKAYAPEPFTLLYQRSLYQSHRNLMGQVFNLLQKNLNPLPKEVKQRARQVLDKKALLFRSLGGLVKNKLGAKRIRCHGDFHLGQVLYTGKDFMIIDFEGEPVKSITERRIKRCPLRDVAGMLRSFHYAMHAALLHEKKKGITKGLQLKRIETWARYWNYWVSVSFFKGYVGRIRSTSVLPKTKTELEFLLKVYLLEKAVYELGYELNHRPDWVQIPLEGILDLADQLS